ncbi:MAG: hypothetical protein KJ571_15190 [Bacteroidetes bacterium]|nr:hypothetical protein [Bacteroidota bacterium]
MYTIIKINETNSFNSAILDLKEYKLPEKGAKRKVIHKVYSPIPKTGFDIYDYEMIFNDEGTKKIIREGETIACFYIESPGMRSLLKRLECDSFEMLTAASSIIRPGVAESGMMQEFIARHKDPKRREYLIPEMEKYLGETYGVMIYQEDVIKIAHHIGGLSLEEADLLRRAMSGKMRSHKAMKKVVEHFFESCIEKGYGERITKELWRQIESFAGYAFCKAHSASFALLSFQVAYLKVHYPAEFMSNVLNNGGGFYMPGVYINEAKRMGLKILLPCVNKSKYNYEGREGKIRIGFLAIKNLEKNTALRLIEERNTNGKYMSLADFLVRTKTSYEQTKLLIKCGAMDCFNQTRPTLMRLLDIYFNHKKLLDDGHYNLFAHESTRLEKEVETDIQYSISEICAMEYELFGYMTTKHPMEFFKKYTDSHQIINASELKNHVNKRIKMAGWYMASKRIKTKKGDIMKFLSLEDLSGTFEAVIFPKAYQKFAELTMSMGPYLIEGRTDLENGNNIIVEKLQILSDKDALAFTQKDSSENKYYGDVEKVNEDEFIVVSSLDKEKLRKAYV